ncbi:MAG: hypothetical protein QW356_06360 [Candidatus Hadarchaeales archaeon]
MRQKKQPAGLDPRWPMRADKADPHSRPAVNSTCKLDLNTYRPEESERIILLELVFTLSKMGVPLSAISRTIGTRVSYWFAGGIPSRVVARRFFSNGGIQRVLQLMTIEKQLHDSILGYLKDRPRSTNKIVRRTGFQREWVVPALEALERQGLVERTGPWGWRLTREGFDEVKLRGL